MNKTLMIWPPELPTSANSFTYHYIDFIEPLSYIQAKGYQVTSVNMGLLDSFKQEMFLKILEKPEKIAIYGDIHMKHELEYTIEIINRISPSSNILIYGPITSYYMDDLLKIPRVIIGGYGDYEKVIEKFILGDYSGRIVNGDWLKGCEIEFPNLDLFNPHRLQRLLDLDRNRNQPTNVGMSVSRGCGYKCTYCRMTKRNDIDDRRVPISNILEYIKKAKGIFGINYFKFLSPNFAFDKKWCFELCEALIPLNTFWKCCTRPEYFKDKEMVSLFKKSGCVSISVGLEVFSNKDYKEIGRPSQINSSIRGVKNLRMAGISVKCLVMLGVPNVTNEEIKQGVALVESLGAVVRPSLYTDYSKIRWCESEYADKRSPVHIEHSDDYLMELVYDRKGKMY